MGAYLDIFSFTVPNSQCCIMKILIEPVFRKAVCFQVHQMPDESFMLFWNFELHGSDFISSMKRFAKSNNLPYETTLEEVLENHEFLKGVADECPIHSVILNPADISVITASFQAPLPGDVEYRCGLDGHTYTMTIFDNTQRNYRFHNTISQEYESFKPLINLVIHYAKLDYAGYGLYNFK